MPLQFLLRTAGWVASGLPVPEPLREALPDPWRSRHRWMGDGRAHIEVHGLRAPGTEKAAEALERRLGRVEGVARAEANAALGRVVVVCGESSGGEIAGGEMAGGESGAGGGSALDGASGPDGASGVNAGDLVAAVRGVERDYRLTGDSSETPDPYPDLRPPVREAFALGADLAGVGLSVATWLARAAHLPPAVPTLISAADYAPLVRTELEKRIGSSVTELAFAFGSAATQAMAERPLGLLIDAAHRSSLLTEAVARWRTWERREGELGAEPGAHRVRALEASTRPEPLRRGPVERCAELAVPAGLASYGITAAATRNHQRGLALLAASLPKAARLGRDGFAAQLGRTAAGKGVIIGDAGALRRLDRVDTVLLDAAALTTGDQVVADVLPVSDGVDLNELHARAHELVDVTKVHERHARDGWAVQPASRLSGPVWREVSDEVRDRTRRGATVLAVSRDTELVGLVSVVAELDPLAESLVAAAREAGAVVLAGKGSRLDERLTVDGVVAAGPSLLSSLRELQEAGHGVALVSARGGRALAAADVGVGLLGGSTRPPWGAHLLCGPGLAEAHMIVDAIATARRVSRRSAQLALSASAVGAVLAVAGPASGATGRATFAVNSAAVTALAAGTWSGLSLDTRPVLAPADRTPWHALPVETVLERLDTTPAGLSAAEAVRRAAAGPGDEPRTEGFVRASLRELDNPLTPALAAGAGISAAAGSVVDGVLIAAVMATNALVGGAQRLGADRAMRHLLETSATRVWLRRGDTETESTGEHLVAGDVIALRAGDAVPADCRVLEADGLEVDESSLTGEAQLVAKAAAPTWAPVVAERHSMVYEGTAVAAGSGFAVVVAVGAETEIGRTVRLTSGAPEVGGVQRRMRALTKVTLPVSLGGGVALLAANVMHGRPLWQALDSAVGLAVAAVPEGLPFVATSAQLAAARRLSARGALVRRPSTIEALGRADVLCFDKTGTLTEGRLSLRLVSDGAADRTVEELTPWLRRVVAAGLQASPREDDQQSLPHPTDQAVVSGAQALGVSSAEDLEDPDRWERVEELPFEPGRGYHAVLGRSREGQRLSVKGAPELILDRCDSWRREDGEVPFDDEARRRVEREAERLARSGYRVLAVAERPASDRRDLDESRIRGLRLLGLLGLADPVRPTAAAAVGDLQRAGVDVMMITGDHPSTAEAIAADLNALGDRRVMTGSELDALDEETLAEELGGVAVFARVSPEQKGRIVEGLRRAGRTVAVTGDGANDAPAIRLADVGVALGSQATPAAREAADLVVADDRIETITDAIIEGRAMWASVRDALSILLGGNLGEIAFSVGTAAIGGAGVLNARQLLLVNLMTDMLPALAISVRPPPGTTREVLLGEGPEASLGAALNRDIYLRATVTAGAATAAWLAGRVTGTAASANTIALVALVATQLGQTMVVGGRSPLVIGASLASLVALGAVVQFPGVSQFFGCRPLGPRGWTIALGAAAAGTAAGAVTPRLLGWSS